MAHPNASGDGPALRLLVAALCAAAAARTVQAQEEQDRDRATYTLGEVIVVVGDRPRGVATTEAVRRVTAEELEASGAATLEEALALLPGVNVRVGGEGVPRVDVRGFRTRHVLLLLDGVPVASAVDAQFDPTLLSMESVAAIEVVEGPASVLYGPGGLGGVVNVITRKGVERLQVSAGAEAGDHAPYLLRASAAGAAGPVDLLLSGSATRVNAFPLGGAFDGTAAQPAGYRLNSDRRRANLLANVGYAPRPDLDLGLTLHYAHASYGRPSSVFGNDADPFAATPRFDRVPASDLLSVQAAGDHEAAPWLRIRGWAYVNRLHEEDDRYDDARYATFDLRSGSYQQDVRSTATGAAVRPRIDLGGGGAIGLLVSAERDGWTNRGQVTVGRDAFVSADFDRWAAVYSAAVEYEVSPLRGLGFVAGYARHLQARAGRPGSHDFSALAAGWYEATTTTRLKASCGRNVRFPSLADLYAPGQGNPALAAERALTCAAGADVRPSRGVTVGATAFYTWAEDLIQTDQATGLSANLADVRFAGAELTAAARVSRSLTLRAGYGYLHSEDRSRAGRDEQQYTPRHKATAAATYDFAFGLSTYLSAAFVGDQFYYPRNGFAPVKRKLADHLVVDARVRQRLLDDRFVVYAGATNLLDQAYETSYGFPQPGRFVYCGVEVRM